MNLTSQNVCAIFDDSLSEDGFLVEGVMQVCKFNPERLESHRQDVIDMVKQLNPTFINDGWSFLNLCMDANDNLWTGEHVVCEKLIMLGIGLGIAQFPLPREFWSMLPGGLPYVNFEIDLTSPSN